VPIIGVPDNNDSSHRTKSIAAMTAGLSASTPFSALAFDS
jgi:hypothetical protein